MSKKLFVGGLDWNTSDEDLRQLFSSFGEVQEAKIIVDRETGRSRGFGFVTLAEAGAADRAIQELDGSTQNGRTIKVNEAQEKSGSRDRQGGGGGGYGGPRGGGDDRGRKPRY